MPVKRDGEHECVTTEPSQKPSNAALELARQAGVKSLLQFRDYKKLLGSGREW